MRWVRISGFRRRLGFFRQFSRFLLKLQLLEFLLLLVYCIAADDLEDNLVHNGSNTDKLQLARLDLGHDRVDCEGDLELIGRGSDLLQSLVPH